MFARSPEELLVGDQRLAYLVGQFARGLAGQLVGGPVDGEQNGAGVGLGVDATVGELDPESGYSVPYDPEDGPATKRYRRLL